MDSQKNRIENEINLWLFKEEKVKNLFKRSPSIERSCVKEKLKFYKLLLFKYRKTRILDELLVLQFVRNERKNLARQLYPNKFERLLSELFNSIFITRINKREYLKEQEENKKSLKYQLNKSGFHDYYSRVLDYMKQEQSQFFVPVSYYISEKERIEHSLCFIKDARGGYDFDGFRSILHNYSSPYVRSTHYFKYEKSESFNIGEAYNLLTGRPVFKEGTWKQFDLNDQDLNDNYRMKEFPEAYGYSIEKVLTSLPLKVSDQAQLDFLASSLKEGRREEVALLINNKEERFFIEANPQFKTLNIFNEKQEKLLLEKVLAVKKSSKEACKINKAELQNTSFFKRQGKSNHL